MKIDTANMLSISEANQNFSKVTRMVDKNGSAVILKNNVPQYVVIPFKVAEQAQSMADDDLFALSDKLMKQNKKVYEELAK
ncbi:type II toxin-antitoxin system Phd/YefM family antitoxin [Leadbettera azotonutricia]|uniref:Conserved domain protein n=1 Tax=Leadbettera azotonutricia (strain ATCC BAA-888 / DSM 13862 / ZAS-9) TaxID=545695 RepID=F5YEY2_LEAAZ|nr:type II toxin-antitoxin system Phd/YefM family antitoxin [Leadbettera azotonutricia]AEF81818.1 conserved domain protein [Leadbettera azotonutricia ZAS-9]